MPEITGIAHVELSVSNLEVSTAWYSAVFDAPEVFRAAQEAFGIVATAIRDPKSGTVLAFTEHSEQEGGRFTPRRVGLDHVCFMVAGEAELDAWARHLDSLGIEHSPVQDYGYGLAITCADPDGIALEFMYPVQRTRSQP
jgi:glyoxylase I family protein